MNVGLTPRQAAAKRSFDVVLSALALLLAGWVVPVLVVLARRDTGGSGIFRQVRVGRDGAPFEVLKIRTMRVEQTSGSTVTTRDDPRITQLGAWLRRWKLDEIPQLWNVLRGDMSFVGPRPDVPGYYDRLVRDDRALLSLRPGITSPASLVYRDEEALLAAVHDPQRYNDEVLFPRKVAMNLQYLESWSLWGDLAVIFRTVRQVW